MHPSLSHSLSCMLENCLIPRVPATQLPYPLTGLVFHFDSFTLAVGGQAQAQFFLAFLLAPFVSSWPRFCSVALVDLIDLTMEKAIGGAGSIGVEVVTDCVSDHPI